MNKACLYGFLPACLTDIQECLEYRKSVIPAGIAGIQGHGGKNLSFQGAPSLSCDVTGSIPSLALDTGIHVRYDDYQIVANHLGAELDNR